MATTGIGAVHVDAIRLTQTARHVGEVLSADPINLISCLNASAVTLDVWTPTVGGAYTQIAFQAPDESSSTTTSATGSTAANLADDLSAIDRVTQWYSINETTAVATGLIAGEVGTFTNTTNITWAHTATGSEGEDIPVGYGVIRTGAGTSPGMTGVLEIGLPTTSSESAQVKTYACTSAASALFRAFVQWNGKVYESATTVHNTDTATTVDDLVTAINAVMPAESVIASRSSDNLVLTAEVEGQSFDAWIAVSGSGSAEAVPTYTTGNPGSATSDLLADFVGVVTRTGSINDSDGDAVINPMRMAEVLRKGTIVVENSQGVSWGDQVFLSVASSTKGKFYNANATDYVPIPLSRARWVRDQGDGTAILELL